MAFLTNNQTVKIDEASLCEQVVVCHPHRLQFSNENPPRCSGATVPPMAAILENFVESSLLCMYSQLKPLKACGLLNPASLSCQDGGAF